MNLQNKRLKMRIAIGILMISGAAQAATLGAKTPEPAEMAQQQLAESALLLRSSQNPQVLRQNQTVQLMNLCKVIGQSQVLLLQINTNLGPKFEKGQKVFLAAALQDSITDLQKACDGNDKQTPDQLLKRAWQLTGQVQKRLTKLSRSLLQKEET